jgi:hypothetical protein
MRRRHLQDGTHLAKHELQMNQAGIENGSAKSDIAVQSPQEKQTGSANFEDAKLNSVCVCRFVSCSRNHFLKTSKGKK